MGTRTFIALDLDDAILDGLQEVRMQLDDPQSGIRWTDLKNLHLTLRFLGDVDDEMLAKVCELTADAAHQVDPFEFELKGIVCVPPSGRNIRMLWANIIDDSGSLASLYEILAGQLSGLGLKEDKRGFSPHITLARIKFIQDPPAFRQTAAIYAERSFGLQHVSEVVTYSSRLTPQGPIYTALASAPLNIV